MKITVDGPAGSGKSYIAKGISRKLRIPYLETGLAYRAVGYALIKRGEDLRSINWEKIKPILDELRIVPRIGETKVFLGGEEVSEDLLRSEEVGKAASVVGTVPRFREFINELFRKLVGKGQAVVEGRDAGTHIFPDADIKLFVTASPEERALRRWKQLREKGMDVNLEEILESILERDRRDMERENYPFRPAEDAVVIDTTGMGPEESLQRILHLVVKMRNEKSP